MSTSEDMVVHSPKRKQLGGLWFLFVAISILLFWANQEKEKGTVILFILGAVIFLLGLYRLLTVQTVTFFHGSPNVEVVTKHFGFMKSSQSAEFDDISLLRRDNLLPFCQLYAYMTLNGLKKKLSESEYAVYEKEQRALPGLIIIDNATKKECEELLVKVWRFYGLWDDSESD
jgi:hypothetical protein